MGLTKRRLQFLDKLNELYQRTNLPIHYETLAKSLGVSKWTAYDMLKEIEKLGFVSRSYEVNTKETGRSQVVFAPTDKTFHLFLEPHSEAGEGVDWKRTVGKITALLRNLTHTGMSETVRRLLDELPEKASGVEYCGCILGVLSLQLRKLGGKTESLIRLAMSRTQSKETQMIIFAGTVLGAALGSVSEELGSRLTELVADFSNTVQELTSSEKELLSDLLTEALA